MADLFSGLEQFGLGKLKDLELYPREEKQPGTGSANGSDAVKQFSEADFLFDKSYTCPVCDHPFKSKAVKAAKARLLVADSDLRPRYQGIDSLKYDAIVCPACGYAALGRFFNKMTLPQARLIKEQISTSFQPLAEDGALYTYDQAIMRHKLALVSTIVTRGKTSERAYTCLKLAWLYRGKRETLPKDTPEYEKVRLLLVKQEYECIKNAYEGFTAAFMKENFPICGMDENTLNYLAAELARKLGRDNESLRLVSRILIARDANERIKEKAREIKDRIYAKKTEAQ